MDLLSKLTSRGKDECLNLLQVDVNGLEDGDGAKDDRQPTTTSTCVSA